MGAFEYTQQESVGPEYALKIFNCTSCSVLYVFLSARSGRFVLSHSKI